jgi:hypothetical protein
MPAFNKLPFDVDPTNKNSKMCITFDYFLFKNIHANVYHIKEVKKA